MMLESGQWLGRGSVLVEGHSRGHVVECDVRVARDATGATLTGSWRPEGDPACDFLVRLAGNDVGTYTLTVRLGSASLQGTAKLDSQPNLGLLWNDEGTMHATFTLFSVPRGYGFRGFVRQDDGASAPRVFTWEVAFSLKQEVLKGDNVVSLRRRR
jgi:hypothetical protein